MSADHTSQSPRGPWGRSRESRRPQPKARPGLERFEDRQLLATFLVSSVADSGPGSFRQAILDSNAATAQVNTINFNLPPGGLTIAPQTNLPAITQPVTIDGTSQTGYAGAPVVELSGSAGATVGLDVAAAGSTVRGLDINRFANAGVVLEGAGGSTITSNYIGTDAVGTAPLPNGVGIQVASPNNTIGGANAGNRIAFNTAGVVVSGSGNAISSNIIAGNSGPGVRVDSGTGNAVTSNAIMGNLGGGIVANNGATLPSAPQLTAPVAATGGQQTVGGTLDGLTASTSGYRVQIFGNAADASPAAQGQTLLGETTVSSDVTGHAAFSVTYTPSAGLPVITATVSDPSGTTSAFSAPVGGVTVTPTPTTNPADAAPPTISAPTSQSINQNNTLAFATTNGNLLQVQSASSGNSLQLNLGVAQGTLKLAGTTGLVGTGDGTGTLSYTGTSQALNQALAGLVYTPTTGYVGSDALTITAIDKTVPAGTPAQSAATVPLTILAASMTPATTAATTVAGTQTTGGLVITAGLGTPNAGFFKISNVVGGGLYQADGVTPVASGSFITAAQGAAGLKFTPSANFVGTGSFSVQGSTSAADAGLVGTPGSGTITVGQVPTTITVASSSPTSYVGGQLTLTAKVSPALSGGLVTFYDGVAPIGQATLTQGQASVTTHALSNGPHSITAKYGGTPTAFGSVSPGAVVQVFQTIGMWRGANSNASAAPSVPTAPPSTGSGTSTGTTKPPTITTTNNTTGTPSAPVTTVVAPIAPPAAVATPAPAPTATTTTTVGLSFRRKLLGNGQTKVNVHATVKGSDGTVPPDGTFTFVTTKKGSVQVPARAGVADYSVKARYPSKATVTVVYSGNSQFQPSVSQTVYVARKAPRSLLAREITYTLR